MMDILPPMDLEIFREARLKDMSKAPKVEGYLEIQVQKAPAAIWLQETVVQARMPGIRIPGIAFVINFLMNIPPLQK